MCAEMRTEMNNCGQRNGDGGGVGAMSVLFAMQELRRQKDFQQHTWDS